MPCVCELDRREREVATGSKAAWVWNVLLILGIFMSIATAFLDTVKSRTDQRLNVSIDVRSRSEL